MEWFDYILKIIYQPIFIGIVLLFVSNKGLQKKKITISFGKTLRKTVYKKNHGVGLSLIFLLAIFQGIYSIICGPYNVFLADREYYAIRFLAGTFNPASSLGVYYISSILSNISHNPYLFFFVTGWLFFVITLIAYNESDDSTPIFFVLLSVSQYVMYGCYQIKQSIAMAISGLSVVILLKSEKQKKISTALLIVLAICFHEVAWMMVPVFIIIIFSDKKFVKYTMYGFMLVMLVAFNEVSRVAIRFISHYIPSLAIQMTQYIDNTGSLTTGNSSIISIIKGIPFYWVLFYSFLRKRELKTNIREYNSYVLLTVIVAVTSLLSAWNLWMWRFGELLYIPFFIFVCQIYKHLKLNDRKLFLYPTILSLAFFTFRKLFICYFNYGGII